MCLKSESPGCNILKGQTPKYCVPMYVCNITIHCNNNNDDDDVISFPRFEGRDTTTAVVKTKHLIRQSIHTLYVHRSTVFDTCAYFV